MILYACEECMTIWNDDQDIVTQPGTHAGHHVVGFEGRNDEETDRVAVRHLMLARRMRGGGPYGLIDYRSDQSKLDEAMPYNAAGPE